MSRRCGKVAMGYYGAHRRCADMILAPDSTCSLPRQVQGARWLSRKGVGFVTLWPICYISSTKAFGSVGL